MTGALRRCQVLTEPASGLIAASARRFQARGLSHHASAHAGRLRMIATTAIATGPRRPAINVAATVAAARAAPAIQAVRR